MRISWLEPAVIRATRNILLSHHADWDAHFTPRFTVPPTPDKVDPAVWPRIAEHVARAEMVSAVVRDRGLDSAVSEFGESSHAIELATVIAAALQAEQVTLELCEALFACSVDELIIYGTFLQILIDAGGVDERDRVIASYELFVAAAAAKETNQSVWPDRVDAVTDGLASLYVSAGRFKEADAVFERRHETQTSDLAVALTAGRSYLSAGAVGRAVYWLGVGEQRALQLGRTEMAATLAKKQTSLKKRLS